MNREPSIFDSPPAVLAALVLTLVVLLALSGRLLWGIWREVRRDADRGMDRVEWSSSEAGIVIAWLLFFYSQLALAGAFLAKAGLLASSERQAFFLIVGQGVYLALSLVLVGWMLRRKKTSARDAFGLANGPWSRITVVALGGLAAIFTPMILVSWGAEGLLRLVDWPLKPQVFVRLIMDLRQPELVVGLVFLTVIGAPVVEETLFRGIFYPYLRRKVGLRHAIWINSLLFAAAHGHLPSLPPLFVLAVMFSILYEWQRNLLAPVICHAAFNTLSLTFLLVTPRLISGGP